MNLAIHGLPMWFLVFALFLPRMALLLMWLQNMLAPSHLQGVVGLVLGLVLPRVLVLFLIYLDQGISTWFLIHLVVALLVWGGSGGYGVSRRRRDYRQVSLARACLKPTLLV